LREVGRCVMKRRADERCDVLKERDTERSGQ
jgi:hypothetical protein